MKEFGLPEIYEHQASGNIKLVYEDIKNVLKVPIVNFIFRSLSLYGDFLPYAWDQIRPCMLSINLENSAASLRSPELKQHVKKINWSRYYDHNTISRIKEIVKVFRYVNPKLLIMAQAWFEALSGRPITGNTICQGLSKTERITTLTHIPLVDIDHVPLSIRKLLLDIAEKHRAMDVASDYRALAFYPEFLNIVWKDLGPYTQTKEYQLTRLKLSKESLIDARNLPFPIDLKPYTHGENLPPAVTLGIMTSVSMFKEFLPGLIIDCEFLHEILH